MGIDIVSKTKILVEDPVEVMFLVDRVTGAFCRMLNADKVMNLSLVFVLMLMFCTFFSFFRHF
jgi:hypothetical protein